jgi:hypothetical protein
MQPKLVCFNLYNRQDGLAFTFQFGTKYFIISSTDFQRVQDFPIFILNFNEATKSYCVLFLSEIPEGASFLQLSM